MTAPILHFGDIDLDALLRSRLLVQANSGGGKSHLLRTLLEQTHGKVQHIVLDPEGEFSTLRQRFSYVLAGRDGDVPAHPKVARVLCRRLLELGASAVIDLYDLSMPDRREFVKLFLTELMALPRALWKPTLIVLDEAHVYAPERGSGEAQSTDAVITLCTQGRKRGYCAVLATQRISKLHKDAAAELLNKAVGRTGLDVDMRRAGEELGFDREQRSHLRELAPGEFFVYGPALGTAVRKVRSADVLTNHPDAGRALGATAPPANASVQALVAQIGDLPALAVESERTIADLEATVKQLRQELRTAQRATRPEVVNDAALVQARSAYADAADDNARLRGLIESTAQSLSDAAIALRGGMAVPSNTRIVPPSAPSVSKKPAIVPQSDPIVSRTVERVREASADAISGPQQRMLDVMAQFEAYGLDAPAYSHVAVMSSQSPRSSGFDKNLGRICTLGLVARRPGKLLQLTDGGRAAAAPVVAPRSLDDLHEAWMRYVSGPQQRMLRELIRLYPQPLEYAALAIATQQSVTSSGFDKNLTTLSGLGLVTRHPGKRVSAGALLFPEGLARA